MEIQNVKEGAFALSRMIAYTCKNNKMRKSLVQGIKTHIVPMCCDQYSHLIIIRILDVYDDSKFVNKQIINAITQHFNVLCYNDFGRLILSHLLVPRSDRIKYFHTGMFAQICPKPMTMEEYNNNKSNNKNNKNNNNSTKQNEKKEAQTKSVDNIEAVESSFLADDSDDSDDEDVDITSNDKKKNKDNENKNENDEKQDIDVIGLINQTQNVFLRENEATSKKDRVRFHEELLASFLPKLMDFCLENYKPLMMHDLGGSIVVELFECLAKMAQNCEDTNNSNNDNDNSNSNNNNNNNKNNKKKNKKKNKNNSNKKLGKDEIMQFFTKFLTNVINDDRPLELDEHVIPQPIEAEYYKNLAKSNVELTNIVGESMQKVHSSAMDEKQQQLQDAETKNININNVDLSVLDAKTAQNIARLQAAQAASANDEQNKQRLIKNAEYTIASLEYDIDKLRHKERYFKYATKFAIVDHQIGQRKICKLIELIPSIHEILLNILIKKNDWNKWIFDSLFVWDIYQLLHKSEARIQKQLADIIKPLLNENQLTESELNEQKGLKKLNELMQTL